MLKYPKVRKPRDDYCSGRGQEVKRLHVWIWKLSPSSNMFQELFVQIPKNYEKNSSSVNHDNSLYSFYMARTATFFNLFICFNT